MSLHRVGLSTAIDLSPFNCEDKPQVEKYLKETALAHQKQGIMQTSLFLDHEGSLWVIFLC